MTKRCDLWMDQAMIKQGEKVECLIPMEYREMCRHDYENVLAAWVLCRPFSISSTQFCNALQTFKKPPHRIQFVREIEGVLFYDDSKGTNIDAVVQAVKGMKGAVILIVGGIDKGASYLLWKEHFSGKVKKMIAIGEAAPKIYNELHPYFNIELAESLASAVDIAAKDAKRGDSVLLSPGCSSFDMFRDYAHRGEEFQHYVQLIRRSV
jgi:UDP-N-acetylmuramoylalanine--D-glutamate ligase